MAITVVCACVCYACVGERKREREREREGERKREGERLTFRQHLDTPRSLTKRPCKRYTNHNERVYSIQVV